MKKENEKKKTPKQIAALVCVILLGCLYLITLLAACLHFPGWDKLFSACLFLTIAVPVFAWIFIWFSGILKQRRDENLHQFDDTRKESK